jgi:nitrilase
MNKFTVSVAQVSPVPGLDATLEKVDRFARQAAQVGSKLILFPEALLGGYPRGAEFGAKVGERTLEGRQAFRVYWEQAVDVPGPAVDALGRIAAEHALHLVIGVIERDGGTLYCTVLFFGPDGAYMGKHRKLMPTGSERLIWGFGDGSTLPVFDTPLGKLGAVVCWENYMPLMRAAHYAKGIQIYCAPTADGRDTWLPTMQHIAMEGRCFVLSSNQFARRSHYPETFAPIQGGEDSIVSRGGSCIVDPMGRVLAGPDFDGETVLTAEIDIGATVEGKYDFDCVGHYARPDIFNLTVNEAAQAPVRFKDSPENN